MRLLIVLGIWVIAGQAVLAQGGAVPLKPATAILPVDFALITAARELSDGRVLISDPLDKRLVVADFRTGTVAQIGRIGSGPKEYQYAVPAIPLTGDSSLMAVGTSRRWLMLDGAKIVGSIAPDAKIVRLVHKVHGADDRGNVLTTVCPPADHCGPPQHAADSASIALVARNSGNADIIGKIWSGPVPTPSQSRSRPSAYGAGAETAILAHDGWTAVFRVNPFRVDWRSPTAEWTLGAPLPFDPIRIDRREKQAQMLQKAGGPPNQTDAHFEWPAAIPPWSQSSWQVFLITTSDGKLLINRTTTADHPEVRFDVVNHRGQIERTVRIGDRENIVGFGKGTIYVASDADDIQRLRRHPWP